MYVKAGCVLRCRDKGLGIGETVPLQHTRSHQLDALFFFFFWLIPSQKLECVGSETFGSAKSFQASSINVQGKSC